MKSERRRVVSKKSGLRSDNTEWFGIVLEEKIHSTDGVVTLYPEKMMFLRSKALWDQIEEGADVQIVE